MGDALPAVSLGTGRSAVGLSAEGSHTCALLDDRSVKCWGYNVGGQLGLGDRQGRGDNAGEMGDALPAVDVGTGRTVLSLSRGSTYQTCAVLDDASLKCWGDNSYAQLGLGDSQNRGDDVGEMGNALPSIDLGSGRSSIAVATAMAHTCAVLDDGSLKCWGTNGGLLGLGDTLTRGDSPGEMGDNLPIVFLGTGRCGDGVITSAETCEDGNSSLGDGCGFCQVERGYTCAGSPSVCASICGDGLRVGSEACDDGNTSPGDGCDASCHVEPVRPALSIAAGGGGTCAILDDRSTKCWGGSVGDGPGEMGDGLAIVDLGVGRTAIQLAPAGYALLDDFSVRRGRLFGGVGVPILLNLGTGRHALAITKYPRCALLDDHSIKCWGTNLLGELGLGSPDSVDPWDPTQMGDALPPVDLGSGRTALAVSAAYWHTCALLDDHTIKCWGDGGQGALGNGDMLLHGQTAGSMGNALPAVDLGTGRTALAVATGDAFTCAILDDHSVKCWGNSYGGQLGLGDTSRRGDGPGEMGDALPTVDLGSGRSALAIDAGGACVCVILDDHSVKCWGSGPLGLGDTAARGDEPGEMGDALPAVDLGTGRSAVALSVDGQHTCAILDDSSVKCWGNNNSGQLGLGDRANRGDEPGEMGDNLPIVFLGTGRCGDGAITGGEACDDANAGAGDGCLSCQVEPGFTCVGAPSVCF